MLCHVVWQTFTDVLEVLAASIIRALSCHCENLKSCLLFVIVIKLIFCTVIWCCHTFDVSHVRTFWTLNWCPVAPRNFLKFSSCFSGYEYISVEFESNSCQLQATPSWSHYSFFPPLSPRAGLYCYGKRTNDSLHYKLLFMYELHIKSCLYPMRDCC
jgi:hypothetical protein